MSSGSKRVVGVEVDTNYDKEDEDKKPGYAEGPEGTHSTSRDGFGGESSSVQLGRARTVKGTSKDDFAAEAAGPTLSEAMERKKMPSVRKASSTMWKAVSGKLILKGLVSCSPWSEVWPSLAGSSVLLVPTATLEEIRWRSVVAAFRSQQ